MSAILVWLLAWFIGGTPAVEPWSDWFAFLLACGVLSISQAIAVSRVGQSNVTVFQPRAADEADPGE
jgi:hypothetical protein